MSSRRIRQIVRQFPENGMKLLLERPANVRDLLRIAGGRLARLIDLDRLTLVRTTYVKRDFRHVEADVVLTAPLRGRGDRPRRDVLVYILIEHQSAPDTMMPLRLLEYVVQIYRGQERRSSGSLPLMPVVPIVFYTGTDRWDAPGRLQDLIAAGDLFEEFAPVLNPLFVNLSAIAPERLESEGGFFGRTLRLLKERKSRPRAFRRLLARVVRELEAIPGRERSRWLELLSYIHALVYHVRDPAEASDLQEAIAASVQTDRHRQEIFTMGKTMADVLREEGEQRGREEGERRGREEGELRSRRQVLLRQLSRRFGRLPAEVTAAVEETRDIGQLDAWLDGVVTAANLDGVGIGRAR